MSDYMTATVEVPTFALGLVAIQEAIHREGSPNQETAHPDGTTTVVWDQAPWGEVFDVEETLKTLGIAFDRHSDAKYEYNAASRLFRPATDAQEASDATIYTLAERQSVITVAALEELAETGQLTLEAIRAHIGIPSETVAEWTARQDATTFLSSAEAMRP